MEGRSTLACRGVASVVLSAVLVGCSSPPVSAGAATSSAAERPKLDDPAVARLSQSERDQEVIDVVLQDALSGEGEHPPFFRPPEALVVRRASKSSAPRMDYLLRHYRDGDWARFPPVALASLKVAALDLIRRASSDEIDLASTDPRIFFVAPGCDAGRPYGAPVITVLPPGYGLDCELAIVHFVIPWMLDFGDATYVLMKSATGWDVVVRQVIFHP